VVAIRRAAADSIDLAQTVTRPTPGRATPPRVPAVAARERPCSPSDRTPDGAAQGRSVAQVVLRWLVQRGVVAVAKSVRPDRMAGNLDVFDCELTDEQLSRIAPLDTGESRFFSHRDPAMVSAIGTRRIHD
jgi:aryl-alcohol dehydrogenase-like predicted oxidoreductase